MRALPATLSDVAAMAGVDASTVSRVLNGQAGHRVNIQTRERIMEAARALAYHPHVLARGLRTAHTKSLCIVVPFLDSPVFVQIVHGAERAARDLGYSLLITHISENAAEDATYEQIGLTNQVDGLLVSTVDEDSVTIRAVQRARLPFVIVNRKVAGVPGCIAFDMQAATSLAIDHLVGLGHRRIAHLGANPGKSSGARLEGYRSALERAGIAFDPELVAISGYDVEGGAAAMHALLRRPGPRPTAVFPLTLNAALGAMLALRHEGISVPHEMSVITIHDGIAAELMNPPLTTVRMPTREVGEQGVRSLVQLVHSGHTLPEALLSPLELVVRSSTAPPSR
jgi:LacI family transcriptional regulator